MPLVPWSDSQYMTEIFHSNVAAKASVSVISVIYSNVGMHADILFVNYKGSSTRTQLDLLEQLTSSTPSSSGKHINLKSYDLCFYLCCP